MAYYGYTFSAPDAQGHVYITGYTAPSGASVGGGSYANVSAAVSAPPPAQPTASTTSSNSGSVSVVPSGSPSNFTASQIQNLAANTNYFGPKPSATVTNAAGATFTEFVNNGSVSYMDSKGNFVSLQNVLGGAPVSTLSTSNPSVPIVQNSNTSFYAGTPGSENMLPEGASVFVKQTPTQTQAQSVALSSKPLQIPPGNILIAGQSIAPGSKDFPYGGESYVYANPNEATAPQIPKGNVLLGGKSIAPGALSLPFGGVEYSYYNPKQSVFLQAGLIKPSTQTIAFQTPVGFNPPTQKQMQSFEASSFQLPEPMVKAPSFTPSTGTMNTTPLQVNIQNALQNNINANPAGVFKAGNPADFNLVATPYSGETAGMPYVNPEDKLSGQVYVEQVESQYGLTPKVLNSNPVSSFASGFVNNAVGGLVTAVQPNSTPLQRVAGAGETALFLTPFAGGASASTSGVVNSFTSSVGKLFSMEGLTTGEQVTKGAVVGGLFSGAFTELQSVGTTGRPASGEQLAFGVGGGAVVGGLLGGLSPAISSAYKSDSVGTVNVESVVQHSIFDEEANTLTVQGFNRIQGSVNGREFTGLIPFRSVSDLNAQTLDLSGVERPFTTVSQSNGEWVAGNSASLPVAVNPVAEVQTQGGLIFSNGRAFDVVDKNIEKVFASHTEFTGEGLKTVFNKGNVNPEVSFNDLSDYRSSFTFTNYDKTHPALLDTSNKEYPSFVSESEYFFKESKPNVNVKPVDVHMLSKATQVFTAQGEVENSYSIDSESGLAVFRFQNPAGETPERVPVKLTGLIGEGRAETSSGWLQEMFGKEKSITSLKINFIGKDFSELQTIPAFKGEKGFLGGNGEDDVSVNFKEIQNQVVKSQLASANEGVAGLITSHSQSTENPFTSASGLIGSQSKSQTQAKSQTETIASQKPQVFQSVAPQTMPLISKTQSKSQVETQSFSPRFENPALQFKTVSVQNVKSVQQTQQKSDFASLVQPTQKNGFVSSQAFTPKIGVIPRSIETPITSFKVADTSIPTWKVTNTPDTTFKIITTPITTPKTIEIPIPRIINPPHPTPTPPPPTPPPPIPNLPLLNFKNWDGFGFKPKSFKMFSAIQKQGYTPSFTAEVFNIKSVRIPASFKTGLGVRPIITPYKSKGVKRK